MGPNVCFGMAGWQVSQKPDASVSANRLAAKLQDAVSGLGCRGLGV